MPFLNFISETDAMTSAIRYAMETQKVQPYQNIVILDEPEPFQEFLQKMSGDKEPITSEKIDTLSRFENEEKKLFYATTTRLYVDATSFLFNIFNTSWTFDHVANITRRKPNNTKLFYYENYVGEHSTRSNEKGFYSLPFNFQGVSIKVENVTNAFFVLVDKLAERFPHTKEMYIIFERKCSFTDPLSPKYVPLDRIHLSQEDIHKISDWIPIDPEGKVGGGTGHFFEVLFNDKARNQLTKFILQTIVTKIHDSLVVSGRHNDISFYFDGPSAYFSVPQKRSEKSFATDEVPYPLRVSSSGGIVSLLRRDKEDDSLPSKEQHFTSSLANAGNYHFSDFVSTSLRAIYRNARLGETITEENFTIITEEGNNSILLPLLYCYENYPSESYRVSGTGRIWLRHEWFNIFKVSDVQHIYAPFESSGLLKGKRSESETWKRKSMNTNLTIDVIHLYDAITASAFKTVQNMDAFITIFETVKNSPGHFLPFVDTMSLPVKTHHIPKYNWSVSLYDVLIKNAIPMISMIADHEGVATADKVTAGLYTLLFVLGMQARFFMSDIEIKNEEKKILKYVNEILSGKRSELTREGEFEKALFREYRKEKEYAVVLLTSYNRLMQSLRNRVLFNPRRSGVLLSFVCFLMFFTEITDPKAPNDIPPVSVNNRLLTYKKDIPPDVLSNIKRLFGHVREKFIPWLDERIESTRPEENIVSHCFNFPVLLEWMRSIINDPRNEGIVIRIISESYGYEGVRLQAWDKMLGGSEKESGILFKTRLEDRTPEAVMKSNTTKVWLNVIQNRSLGYQILETILNEIMPYLTPRSIKLHEMGTDTMADKVRWNVASHNTSWHPNYPFMGRYLSYNTPMNPWISLKTYARRDSQRFTGRKAMSTYEYTNKFPREIEKLPLSDERLIPMQRWLYTTESFEGKVSIFYRWFNVKGEMSPVATASNYHMLKWFPLIASISSMDPNKWKEVYTHIITPFIQWTFQLPNEVELPKDTETNTIREFLEKQYDNYDTAYYKKGYLNFVASILFTVKGGDKVADLKGYFGTNLLGKESASEFVKISKALHEVVQWASVHGIIMSQNVMDRLPFIPFDLLEGNGRNKPLYNTPAKMYTVLYRAVSTILFGSVTYTRHEAAEKGVGYPIQHVYATTFRPDPISPVFLDKSTPYVTYRLWEINLIKWSNPPAWTRVLYPKDVEKTGISYSTVVCLIPEREKIKDHINAWKIPKLDPSSTAKIAIQRDPFCGKWFLVLLWKFDYSGKAVASALVQTPVSDMFKGEIEEVPRNERTLPYSRMALEWEILLRDGMLDMNTDIWQDKDWYWLWYQHVLSEKGWVLWVRQSKPREEIDKYIKLFAVYLSQKRIRWYINANRYRGMFQTAFGIEERIRPEDYPAPTEAWNFLPSKFKRFLLEHGVHDEKEYPIKMKSVNMKKDLLDWEFSVFLSSWEVNGRVFHKVNRRFKSLVDSGFVPFLPYAERTGVGIFMLDSTRTVINHEKIPNLVDKMDDITNSTMHITPEGKLSGVISSNRVISITRQPAIFMNRQWHKTEQMTQGLFGFNFERAPIYNNMWYIVRHNVQKEKAKITFPGKIIGIAFKLRNPEWNRIQLLNVIFQMDALADPTMQTKPISDGIINNNVEIAKWIDQEMKIPEKDRLYREGVKRWEAMLRKIDK